MTVKRDKSVPRVSVSMRKSLLVVALGSTKLREMSQALADRNESC